MKKYILAMALAVAVCSPAFAQYDVSTEVLPNGRAAATVDVESSATNITGYDYIQLFRTPSDGTGIGGESEFILANKVVGFGTDARDLTGRATITICGDGTTINNNTVYYGPSMVPAANAGRTCDITQAGNATEATADEPAFDSTAFQVLSMDCLTADPGASGVSFTLRSAAAATTPSVTCSVANTKKGCTANITTTTAIASGATIAIAAASAGNQGATPFVCTLQVAY
jgi:hypothetical protein